MTENDTSCPLFHAAVEDFQQDPLHQNAERRDTFSSNAGIAKDYDESRPLYGDDAFELIWKQCGLTELRQPSIFEVGPGTGQATLPMLKKGAKVVACEKSEFMVRQLKEKVGQWMKETNTGSGSPLQDRFAVLCKSVEECDGNELNGCLWHAFDVVAAFTSLHWVTPPGLRILHKVLKPNGWLVAAYHLRNENGQPCKQLWDLTRLFAPEKERRFNSLSIDMKAALCEQLMKGSSIFTHVQSALIPYEHRYKDPIDFWKYLCTLSYIRSLPQEKLSELKAIVQSYLSEQGIQGVTEQGSILLLFAQPSAPCKAE